MYRALSMQNYDAVIELLSSIHGVDYKSQEVLDVVTYCLSEGDSRGLFDGERLFGILLAVNYDTVPEDIFCKLFGCSSYEDLPGGGTIHHALHKKWFVTYIVSILPIDQFVADTLILHFTAEFGKGTIVADPGSKLLYDVYMSYPYKGVELDSGRFYVSHLGDKNYDISF